MERLKLTHFSGAGLSQHGVSVWSGKISTWRCKISTWSCNISTWISHTFLTIKNKKCIEGLEL